MKLKQANAILGLLTILAMVLHVGYSIYTYVAFYYNPVLTKVFSIPFLVLVCLHGVLGMCIVFFQGDAPTGDLYLRQNRRTVLQRVSAALLFPLLILHMNTFSLLEGAAGTSPVLVWLLLLAEVLFFGAVFTHIATSFSNALVTLGLLSSPKARTALDRGVWVLCAILFFGALFSVGKGQLAMFLS